MRPFNIVDFLKKTRTFPNLLKWEIFIYFEREENCDFCRSMSMTTFNESSNALYWSTIIIFLCLFTYFFVLSILATRNKILRSFDRRLFFVVAVRRTLSVALILMVNYMRAYMRQCGIWVCLSRCRCVFTGSFDCLFHTFSFYSLHFMTVRDNFFD